MVLLQLYFHVFLMESAVQPELIFFMTEHCRLMMRVY